MEKSSEKLIRQTSPKRNPFNEMLSEVQLKLPNSSSKKIKDNNVVLEYDPYIDRNSYKTIEQRQAKTPKFRPKVEEDQNYSTMFHVPQKTKNSSHATQREYKSREELIKEWTIQYMEKKSILGRHWEQNIREKQRDCLFYAFTVIKSLRLEGAYTFNIPTKYQQNNKVQRMVGSLHKMQQNRTKNAFNILLKFSKDQSLFGLSNTIDPSRNQKQGSGFLKIDSDCKVKSKLQYKTQKEQKETSQDVSVDSRSAKVLSRKGSQSGAPSEDLSNLILNQAKLQMSGQLDKSLPSIPRALRNSNKKLPTTKQIGDLSIETKKAIASHKKIQNNDLPLESHKSIPNKQLNNQESIQHKEQNSKHSQNPITITYIMRNFNMKDICQSTSPSQKTIQNDIHLDAINRTPFVESFYQPANKQAQPIKNVFVKNNSNQTVKRSISQEVKPCQGRFISPERINQPVQNIRIIKTNDYYPYPQECSQRQIQKHTVQTLPHKPRSHSATPRIRFTFTSYQQVPSTKSIASVKNATNNINPYEAKDCVKQVSLLNKQPHPEHANGNSIHSLPRESKLKISKVMHQQREHIKDSLLPSVYDEYYSHQQHHNNMKNSGKVPMLSGTTSPSNMKNSDMMNSNELGLSKMPKHSKQIQPACFGMVQPKGTARAKSPRDKILVTCSSRGKI